MSRSSCASAAIGPFLEQGDRRASIPDGLPPDELTVETSLKMLDQAAQGDEPWALAPIRGKPVFLKIGRFGPYVQRGIAEDEEKPQNASLLKGMTPADVDLATALKLLTLPRELGVQPSDGEKVMAFNGRFGPYIKAGSETRSLPTDLSPIDVTLEQALALLAEPKKARRGFGAAREPLKELGVSPITNEKVQLFEGATDNTWPTARRTLRSPRGRRPKKLTWRRPRIAGRTGCQGSEPESRPPASREESSREEKRKAEG